MAREIPRDIGTLAKAIADAKVESTEDLRHLTEMLRAFYMDVGEITDLAEFEIRTVLQWFDRGSTKRARAVTRPLKQAQSLQRLAARRAVTCYRTYLKQFAEETARNRDRGKRRFDPEK